MATLPSLGSSFDWDLFIPWGYGTDMDEVSLREAWNRMEPYYEPEYLRRLIAWLHSKGGSHGIGGRHRFQQPNKRGFAPSLSTTFHWPGQEYHDGTRGACAVDLVVRQVGAPHRSPTWSEVPAQGSAESRVWGLHCNIASEPWHMQPRVGGRFGDSQIDGHATWVRAGRPKPEFQDLPLLPDEPEPDPDPVVPPPPPPRPGPKTPEELTEDMVRALPTLRQGDKSAPVRRAQALLNAAATNHVLVEDGHFGSRTAAEVRRFQERKHITVDGVIGRLETWPELLGVS